MECLTRGWAQSRSSIHVSVYKEESSIRDSSMSQRSTAYVPGSTTKPCPRSHLRSFLGCRARGLPVPTGPITSHPSCGLHSTSQMPMAWTQGSSPTGPRKQVPALVTTTRDTLTEDRSLINLYIDLTDMYRAPHHCHAVGPAHSHPHPDPASSSPAEHTSVPQEPSGVPGVSVSWDGACLWPQETPPAHRLTHPETHGLTLNSGHTPPRQSLCAGS